MTHFHNITKSEMDEFLLKQGFHQMNLPKTIELVYGKIVHKGNHRVSLRVYTAINPNGQSREKGSDAIRVMPFILFEKTPTPVAKSKTVKRIETWKKNLQNAIDKWDYQWEICPVCHYPMIERNSKNGKFWGCSTWGITKCNGKLTQRPVDQQVKEQFIQNMNNNDWTNQLS
jgi:hypothetical protein